MRGKLSSSCFSSLAALQATKSEVFETGIKVIDVLVPLERGGIAKYQDDIRGMR